jgi:hypothetical protein
MANIIEVLSNYDGVARAKYIAAAGVSDFQLKSAMASGSVSRVARGVYALPGADAQLISIRSLSAGFHVESQVNVPGMGHLDLMVDGRLGIEADGAGFHMDRTSFEEDRRRWNVTTRRGIPTLIVTYQLLMDHPEDFITMVREALNRLSAAA